MNTGYLEVHVTSAPGNFPLKHALVSVSQKGMTSSVLETDASGQTPLLPVSCPNQEESMKPGAEAPYAVFFLEIRCPGYQTVTISGTEVLSECVSIQEVRLKPVTMDVTTPRPEEILIPPHTLYGEYPPKQPEAELKPKGETGEIVLSRVVIPETIVVHDGLPSDPSAENYYVPYRDYIKNVASSEIYPTWPRSAITANVLAIMSFTLNRVYTEWSRNHDLLRLFSLICSAILHSFSEMIVIDGSCFFA